MSEVSPRPWRWIESDGFWNPTRLVDANGATVLDFGHADEGSEGEYHEVTGHEPSDEDMTFLVNAVNSATSPPLVCGHCQKKADYPVPSGYSVGGCRSCAEKAQRAIHA